jgi:hypothetical protein
LSSLGIRSRSIKIINGAQLFQRLSLLCQKSQKTVSILTVEVKGKGIEVNGKGIEVNGKGFPRSKNLGIRGKYLLALHRKGRLAEPAESVSVKNDNARAAPSIKWSKYVSYARVLTGKA